MEENKVGLLEENPGELSSMRIIALLAIIGIEWIIFWIPIIILILIFRKEYAVIAGIIASLAGVITAIGTLILYKGIQKFGENK